MKIKFLLLLNLLVFASSVVLKDVSNPFSKIFQTQVKEHPFDAELYERSTKEGKTSTVYWPKNVFASIQSQITRIQEKLLKKSSSQDINKALLSCSKGNTADFYKFLPKFSGELKGQKNQITFSTECFKTNIVTLNWVKDNHVEITHEVRDKKSWFCSDTYLYANPVNFHIEHYILSGKNKIQFKKLSQQNVEILKLHGLQVFTFCDELALFIPDLIKSIQLYFGGLSLNPHLPFFGSHTHIWMERANVEFIQKATGHQIQKRKNPKRINLNEKDIKTGDFIGIVRLDGLDQIINWGSGSHVSHTAVAFWIGDELWVMESQNAWYWPRKGIQKNRFRQWVQWADNASYNVVILPLKDEIRKKFNVEKALQWYNTVEGQPYGYHNFLFGWIDTEKENMPNLLTIDIIPVAFSIIERIIPSAIKSIFSEAINMRLGTQNLRIPELAAEIARRNLTFGQVMTIVEKEDWVYSDGKSYVCSSFVSGLYKRAGIFGDIELEATELTPRDVYILDIFDKQAQLPEICRTQDPDLPYCQILGRWKIELPQYSTLKPYAHMSESCPSLAPLYQRIEGC